MPRRVRSEAAPSLDETVDSQLEDSVGYLVRKSHRAFTSALEAHLAEHGISISMWFFLRQLWEEDGLTQKELGERLGLTPSTTVSAMDNLQQRGLIRRRRATADRRFVHIFLTPAGRRLKLELSHYAQDVNEVALRDFTPDERATLWNLLSRILVSLGAGSSGGAAPRP